jgi:two-component system response regulator YesN
MFKTRLSMTFSQYITELKMKKAYSLLATTDLSISRIASLCGYDDSGYFTKVFKKNYDVTPKDFRIKQLFR